MKNATMLSALVLATAAAGSAGEDEAAGRIGYDGSLLVQLAVSDLDRAIAFYRDVLGFRLEERDESLRWARVDPGIEGVTVGLGERPETPGSGGVSLNLGVADVDAARATLEARGVRFAGPTLTIPGVVRLADFEDPDGNRIRLAGDPSSGRGISPAGRSSSDPRSW